MTRQVPDRRRRTQRQTPGDLLTILVQFWTRLGSDGSTIVRLFAALFPLAIAAAFVLAESVGGSS